MREKDPGRIFEEEVRSVARALWNLPPGGGGSEVIDGNEIDCVCRAEDVTHLVECTTERAQTKLLNRYISLLTL